MGTEGIQAIVVTPVKDAVEATLETIQAIHGNGLPVSHVVYNDFSTPETQQQLERYEGAYGYQLLNLADMTTHPSPNYRLVLQDAQRRALAAGLPLIIVESDVVVKRDTLARLIEFYGSHPGTGLIGAITVDEYGEVNFPYLRFKEQLNGPAAIETKKSLSFCCTLISLEFLQQYDFALLNTAKDWFDTTVSYQALEMGFKNYLLRDVPVLHTPHGSRPWKQLKYTNPVKYYVLKFLKRRDRI